MRLLRKAIMPLIPVSLCVRPVVPGELSSNIFFFSGGPGLAGSLPPGHFRETLLYCWQEEI